MDSYQPIYDAASLQLGGLSYIAQHVQQEVYRVSEAMTAPHVLMRPALALDGTMWCALYGENLMDGVAGFGETPAKAMAEFDAAWLNSSTPDAIRKARQPEGES